MFIIWKDVDMDRYYARICWNSEGWKVPTCEVKTLKLEQPPSYVLKQGFGHEEWLFDFTDSVDGYQYGFLQPVHKGKSFQGKTIDVVLYAVKPNSMRVMVAEIKSLEVLTTDQQAYAFSANTENGRVARMRSELDKLGIDPGPLGIGDLFNVRFRRENVIFTGEPYRELAPKSHFKRLKRYSMYRTLPGPVRFEAVTPEIRKKQLADAATHIRKGTASIVVNDRHRRLQIALTDLLSGYFGSKYVFPERNNIDIAVRKGKRTILIEIKSDSDIKDVLRQALGQVIEYAHWPGRPDEYKQFFIVAPAAETKESRNYLACLQEKYNIPISYCSFSVGDPLPNAFRRPAHN